MKIKFVFKTYIAIVGLALSTSGLFAQTDPHFSQYYAHPLWLNPALTGVIDGDYRASLNVKQQWGAIRNSYLTGAASFDVAPVKNFAYGATILNQKAGDISFNYFSALVSASYKLHFGDQGLQIISFGLQGGLINRSFNLSQARFGNQYSSDMGYNENIASGEGFGSSSSLVPDVNAGIMYFDSTPDQQVNVFAGGSVAHLNQPTERFGDNSLKTPMRFTAHGGAKVKITQFIDIVPNALFMYQGTAREIAFGAYAQMDLNGNSNILFGSNFRVDDSAIAFFGLQVKNMVFGLSYDLNTSTLNKVTRAAGGLELSVSFIPRKGLIGPNFFCPRL